MSFAGKKHSEEERKKISLKISGKNHPQYGKKGVLSPNFGKKRTEESKERMKKAKRGKENPMYGTKKTEEEKNHQSFIMTGDKNPFYGKHHTKETRESISNTLKGKHLSPQTEFKEKEKHSQWKGGKSFEPYSIDFDRKLKKTIRERDGLCCQLCKSKENGKKLAVHHIDYNKKNNNQSNLVSLCNFCHSKTNHNISDWKTFFQNYQKNRCIETIDEYLVIDVVKFHKEV